MKTNDDPTPDSEFAELLAASGNGLDPNFLPQEMKRLAEGHQHTHDAGEAAAELLESAGHGSDPNFLPQEMNRES